MPCPPSMEELEMMRIDRELGEADRIIGELEPQLRRSVTVVEALRARVAPTDPILALEDLAALFDYARAIRDGGVLAFPESTASAPPVLPQQSWPTAEEIERSSAYASFRNTVATRMELCLCVFGTFVARYVRDHGRPRDPDLARAVDNELERHTAHRNIERQEIVTRLERALTALHDELEAARDELDRERAGQLFDDKRRRVRHAGWSEDLTRDRAATIAATLARVRAIDDTTLCTDRCALVDAARAPSQAGGG